MKRIFALLLSVVMLFGTLIVDISAATAVEIIYEKNSNGEFIDSIDYEATVEQYLTRTFASEKEKLDTMTMMFEKNGYQLWVDEFTGEVATRNATTGQILFSNPYDVASGGSSPSVKQTLMSQLIIKYVDNDTEKTMTSFKEAALRGQINFKYIKNGIRVEYSIGREETRMLVPRMVEQSRFDENILDPFAEELNKISLANGGVSLEWRDYYMPVEKRQQIIIDSGGGDPDKRNNEWFKFNKFLAFYDLKSLAKCETDRERNSLKALYPICNKMDVYVCSPDITNNELTTLEGYIKTYVPTYTFEQLEQDHLITEYEGQDKAPALFKLALEYTLDDWGVTVRIPANGLRFDESLYQLTNISPLPFMGAGANYLLDEKEETFTGYNFFPDGAGALFRHEDLAGSSITTINGKVYGQDYAYNTITGSNQQTIRYPVFGVVSNVHETRTKIEKQLVTEAVLDADGNVIEEAVYEDVEVPYTYEESKGYVAIIEEGDALAELSTYHMGSTGKYNAMQMYFYPRPKDSYNLANAISVGANATWTVVSSRKYVGNYKIRYIMLTDDALAKENEITDYYPVNWMGMAEAYRDYLYHTETLSALEESDVKDDIPVYVETFGTLETLEKILSIPVNVMTPLTSFDNVKTMYDELSAQGVSNIKFKLTGYANGGMYSSVPYHLKWENAVGGKTGYNELLDYSAEKGFELFPDFDFVYVRSSTNTLFDGLTLKDHIVKSINDTYMSRRYYSATRQTHVGRFELAISSAYYTRFYDKLSENLLSYYENTDASAGISVGTLGSGLNSDFDEDEPYNREDSKKFTQNVFGKLDSDFDSVMTDSANAYTWKYLDYIINVPLDSSRYNTSSNAIPFIGVVLHGSVQYAGTPLNMEGNIGYSLLKAIENGAGLYFVLCYDNYEELKEDPTLSEYYSVRYDILKEDVVKYYTLLNDLTKDLQLSKIVGHEFLTGERVPDPDEIIADEEAIEKENLENQLAADALAAKKQQEQLLNGRVYAATTSQAACEKVAEYCRTANHYYQGGAYALGDYVVFTIGMGTLVDAAKKAQATREAAVATQEALAAKIVEAEANKTTWNGIYTPFKTLLAGGTNTNYASLIAAYDKAVAALESANADYAKKLEAYNNAYASGELSGFAIITTKLTAYENAVAARDAIADKASAEYTAADEKVQTALADVQKFAGTLENAQNYIAASTALTEAKAELEKYPTAYENTDEYKALKAAADAATTAYEAAVATVETAIASNEDYKAAKKALRDAEKQVETLTSLKSSIETGITTVTTSYPGAVEIGILEDLLATTIADIAVAESDLEAKKAAYNTVYESLASQDATYVSAKAEYDATTTALNAYVDNYNATYPTSAEYIALQNTIATNTAIYDTTVASIKAVYAANTDEYVALVRAQNAAADALKALTVAYGDNAEYLALVAAADNAQAAVDALIGGYATDAAYIALKAADDAADAAIEAVLAKIEAATSAADADVAAIAATFGAELAAAVDAKYRAADEANGVEAGTQLKLEAFLADYNTKVLASDAYKTATEAKAAADKAVTDFTTKFAADAKATDAYKAAEAAKAAADTAISDFNSKLVMTAIRTSVSNLLKSEAAVAAAEAAVVDAQNALETSADKAAYDADKALYDGIETYALAVITASDATIAAKAQADADLKAADTAYASATKNVSSLVKRVSDNIKNQNTHVAKANDALVDAEFANKFYSESADYDDAFKASVKNSYEITKANAEKVNADSIKSIADSKAALELASEVVTVTVTIVDPNETPDDTTTPDGEETPGEEVEEGYEYTKYTDDTGNIVYVEYENGVFFILNFNYFDITVEYEGVSYTVDSYGGVRVSPDSSEPKFFTTQF